MHVCYVYSFHLRWVPFLRENRSPKVRCKGGLRRLHMTDSSGRKSEWSTFSGKMVGEWWENGGKMLGRLHTHIFPRKRKDFKRSNLTFRWVEHVEGPRFWFSKSRQVFHRINTSGSGFMSVQEPGSQINHRSKLNTQHLLTGHFENQIRKFWGHQFHIC